MSDAVPDKVFRMSLQLRWSDLDVFNHVNNARYLTFLEQARIEWLDALDEPSITEDFAPVVASATLDFKQPINYPARVFVELFTAKLGNSSVTLGHRIVAEDRTLHCDGHVVMVWIDRHTGKSMALPDGVRRASESLLQA